MGSSGGIDEDTFLEGRSSMAKAIKAGVSGKKSSIAVSV